MRPRESAGSRWVSAAPLVFVLVWSTGFIGAKYGLPDADPFVLLGLRLLTAAALLGLLAAATRSPVPRRAGLGRSALSGVMLHAGYLGGVFWAIDRGLPAGVAAVIVSLQPVVVAALAQPLLGERLGRLQWLGMALGVVGVVMVLAPGLSGGRVTVSGVLACLVALAGGTAGTLHQKRYGDGIPLLAGTATQYVAAALVLLAAAALTGGTSIVWTTRLVLAFVWLVVPLSIGAVLLLLFLLKRGSASGVSSLFYLVPPATALEAYLLFGEDLALLSLAGILLAAVGVALALRPASSRRRRRAAAAAPVL